MFAAPTGGTTLLGARAVEACHRADVELCVMTGRRQDSASANARMLGFQSYIFEIGAAFVLDGEEHWLTGDWVPREGQTIYERIEESGAPKLLLEHFAGRLEYHDPWHRNRLVSHLLRGDVDVREADALMAERRHECAAACRQRHRPPALGGAGAPRHHARLPPAARRCFEGRWRRGAHARARLRARGVHRHRRLARGHGRQRARRRASSSSRTPPIATRRFAKPSRRTRTRPSRRRPTVRAPTRRSSAPWLAAPESRPQARPEPGSATPPTRREEARRWRDGGAHQRDPVVKRQRAVDQAREADGHRRFEARALQRAGQQRHGLQRLDRLADLPGDLSRRDALGQQLARATVARLWGERRRDEVAGPREADHRLGLRALRLRRNARPRRRCGRLRRPPR